MLVLRGAASARPHAHTSQYKRHWKRGVVPAHATQRGVHMYVGMYVPLYVSIAFATASFPSFYLATGVRGVRYVPHPLMYIHTYILTY